MVQEVVRWRLIVVITLMFLTGFNLQTSAQDFSVCQQNLKDLLVTFNKSFEENDPSLLKNPEYRRQLRDLQTEYAKYHKLSYMSSDSVQRLNNEAIILALSGSYHKALHILESLELSEQDAQVRYNRGLFKLLNRKYDSARLDFEAAPSHSYGAVNALVSFGKQKKFAEGLSFAQGNQPKNSDGKFHYNLGLIHKFNGLFPEAIDELSSAIRQKDEIMAYRLQRGDLYMRTDNQKKAVKDFEKVARRHAKAQIRYANALLSLNQFSNAVSVFQKYLDSGDKTFRGDAYLGLGHSYYGLNQITEAQKYYRLASTMKRETPSLLAGVGNIYLSNHDYQLAYNSFDRAIKKDTAYLPAYLGRAVAQYGMKKFELSLQDFKKAESIMDPDNKFFADLFVTRGFARYYLKNSKGAQDDFTTAIRLDANRYEALAGMSSIMIDQKRYSEAGQFLSRALNHEQNYDRMWSNYGNLLLHFDMFKKAYNVFKKAIALNKKNIKAQNGWGVVLLENDQLDKSMVLFDSLVKENPELPYLQNNHGIVQAYVGNRHEQRRQIAEANVRYEGSFQDFKKAMEVAPSRKFYNVNQGNVYRYWQQYDQASLSYQSYQDKSALNNTAVMYAGQEKMKDAKYYLGVAIQIDSMHRVFQYNMNVLVKGKQQEMMKLVASAGDDGPYSDIGIKYSRDGFVTIYLYDYEYDTLAFPGRHYMPLPVAEYREDYFIPEYDFKFMAYPKKKDQPKVKSPNYKSQKVKMPGRRGKSGTKCPVFS
jgi:tetratricopeptide (TPR) repeat protein